MRSTRVGFNNTECRSFTRGFGRGNSKPYRKPQRPPPQPARKGDLFVEAGKLAVEYLVSHGLLSSNVLSGKWQNGTLRINFRDLKDHRNTLDKEILSSPFKEHAVRNSDFSQENGKEGSSSDKVTARNANNDPDDTHVQMPRSVESSSKDDRDINQMNKMKKDHIDVDSDLKMLSSMPQIKDDSELEKHSDVVGTGREETEDGAGNVDSETKTSMDEFDIRKCEDKHDSSNNNSEDLLKLGGSEKIQTKIRSSLVTKSPNSDRGFIANEESTSDTGSDSREPTKLAIINGSDEIPSSVEILSLECVTTALSGPSFGNVGAPDTSNDVNSTDKVRGEKRGLIEQNIGVGVKRAKQWLSVSQSGDYTQLSDVSGNRSISPDNRPVSANVLNGSNHENFPNVSKGGVGSSVDQGEKQFHPSSFRICDLNLMGSSDFHENRDVPTLLFPSVSASTTDAPIGIDLTMNNNRSLSDMYNVSGSARKGQGIEVIDLESGSQSQQDGNNMPASMEVGMTNMDNIPSNSQNPSDNPNSQNGHSCMISELLDNDNPNCSSVQPEMSSLHNDIGLHHGEGMFGEDDSIYMSLGEIPINILRVWEQHNQERNPFGL